MQHEYWHEAREFSKAEAFLYLIMRAAWEDRTDGYGYWVERGEVVTTISQLSHDWGWGKSRVRRFLLAASAGSQVSLKTDRERTRIRIVNYDKYQSVDSDRESQTNQDRSADGVSNELHNKERRRNNKERSTPSLTLPRSIDTFEVRAALQRWLDHKSEKRQSYKTTGLNALVAKLSKQTPEWIVAAVDYSIAQNYSGIYPESGTNGTRALSRDELARQAFAQDLERIAIENQLALIAPEEA